MFYSALPRKVLFKALKFIAALAKFVYHAWSRSISKFLSQKKFSLQEHLQIGTQTMIESSNVVNFIAAYLAKYVHERLELHLEHGSAFQMKRLVRSGRSYRVSGNRPAPLGLDFKSF